MAEFIALLVAVSLPLACLPILRRLEQRRSGARNSTSEQPSVGGAAGTLDATLSLVADQLVAQHAGLTQEKRARLEANLRSAVEAEFNKIVVQNDGGDATRNPAAA